MAVVASIIFGRLIFFRLVMLLELIILFHSFVKVIVRYVGFFKTYIEVFDC